MRKKKPGALRRGVSIVLVLALVLTSVQLTAGPAEEAKAASTGSTMGDTENLSATHVKDSKVLAFYKILANAQKRLEVANKKGVTSEIQAAQSVMNELGRMNAGQIMTKYGSNSLYTDDVYGVYLTNYAGKIDLSGLTVSTVEGVGWARSASEFDLSSLSITEIPDSEFASCSRMTKISLPASVTKIGNNAFDSCTNLVTLKIGSGTENVVDLTNVNVVGSSAFSGCEAIKTVKFSDYASGKTELKIGASAFASCISLTEIKIPIKTAANLGANAFQNCSKLTKVGLENELAYLGTGLFAGVGGSATWTRFYVIGQTEDTTKSKLPENITYIGNNCFQGARVGKMDLSGCTKLKTINQYGFGAAKITSLTLPDSLTEIATLAFNAASGTVAGTFSLEIPESCTRIGTEAFCDSSIYEITLPDSLTEIQKRTFRNCTSLSKINLKATSKLDTIGEEAFYGCGSLSSTEFLKPLKQLTTIGKNAFSDCYAWLKSDNAIITDSYGEKVVDSGLKKVVLPDCVTTLGESVFANNYDLSTVDLGNGVLSIPEKAFYCQDANGGTKLEKVTVSGELEDIGKSAFENQKKLSVIGYHNGSTVVEEERMIQFNDGLISIGDRAFAGCGGSNRVGSNINGVRTYALITDVKEKSASGLSEFLVYDYENAGRDTNYCRTVYVDRTKLVAARSMNASDLVSGKLTEQGKKKYIELNIVAQKLYLDASKLKGTTGKPIEVYSEYATDVEAYKNRIYAGIANYNSTKKSVDLTKTLYCDEANVATVASISSGSGKTPYYVKVANSSDITNVAVSNSDASSINLAYIFGIENVTLPDTLRGDKLGASAFENCINLNRVILSENLTDIKDSTFSGAGTELLNPVNNNSKYYDYHGLASIYIPDGLKTIGNNAFQKCYNLSFKKNASTSELGISLKSIGSKAFYQCYSLETMKFPSSLETIGSEAFAECALLERVDAYKGTAFYEVNGVAKTEYYYKNRNDYGTKQVKTGLKELDFSTAKKLSSIGTSAFKQTNVTEIQLSDSSLTQIPDSLFEQCSYLRNVTFPDKISSLGQNVLKDTLSLLTVSLPASATVKKNTISGVFGKLVLGQSDPTLTLSYTENERKVVPVGSELRLPINTFNKDVLNGAIKVYVVNGTEKTDILTGAVNGLSADIDTEKEPYSIILRGTGYIKEPLTVQVEAGTKFPVAQSTGYWISPHEFKYQVTVDDVPTDSVSISAAEDNLVKQNPSMYVEDGANKALYMPAKGAVANTGVKLTAQIDPAGTTDDVSWQVSRGSDVVEISNPQYVKGSGIATVVVKPKKIGDAEIKVTSGTKTDIIHVYSKIPVISGGLTCTTGGSLLDTNLRGNSSSSPYGLAIGDSDKIQVSLNYGNDYTEEEKRTYGETFVFESSNEEVIEVKPDGTFKALSEGEASITVKGQASGVKLQFYFNVTDGNSYTPYSVTISGPSEVNVGSSIHLSAIVAPANKVDQGVTWSVVAGANYVSIDANGTVTGLAKGEASIVATSTVKDTVKSDRFTVSVKAPVSEFRILDQNITLEPGRTLTISKTSKADDTKGYYLNPTDTTDTIDWRSSNEGVITVTKTNTSVSIKAVAVGTADVIGTTTSGLSATASVSVVQKANSITVDKEVTLNVGATHRLDPQKVPAEANENLTYTYTSSEPKIAVVDASGVIRAVAPGRTTVTVKSDTGKTASCAVTVKQPAKKITLLLNRPGTKTIYMAKGQSATLNTKLSPDNTTDRVTYKSDKAKVATVTTSGQVTAKKPGKAKITLKTDSGKKLTVTVVVSKKEKKAKKVKVKCKGSMKRKKTMKLTVSLNPSKSTDTLSFASDKPAIASVDAYGYVTAKKKGKVKITVTASSGKKVTKTIKVK